jgi:hypothetical protein
VFVTLSAAARAEGLSGRTWNLSTDPGGIGTVQGAHAPEQGTVVMGLGADYLRSPISHEHKGIAHDLLQSRLTLEPSLVFGLPSAFSLSIRVPVATYDKGFRTDGAEVDRSGIGSPGIGVLIPLVRSASTDTRVSVRGELVLPVGSQKDYRNDGGFAGRGELVFGGPVGPLFMVFSGGALIAPARMLEAARLNDAIVAGAGVRLPDKSPIALIGSIQARVEIQGDHDAYGLAAGGVELRLGSTFLRGMIGSGAGDTVTTPKFWMGFSILQAIDLFPNYQYFAK